MLDLVIENATKIMVGYWDEFDQLHQSHISKKEDGFIINSHTMGFNQKKKNISIEEIKELIQYSTLMNKTGILQISTENEIENLVPPSKRREFKEGEA